MQPVGPRLPRIPSLAKLAHSDAVGSVFSEASSFYCAALQYRSTHYFFHHCFILFLYYSSYKYAEMKYTLLLVVNDVLWSSLCLWIVLCLLCMVYQISIYDEKMSKPPEFCCILIIWDSCETN